METNDLVKYENVMSMVNKYKDAVKLVTAGYGALLKAQENMKALTDYPHVTPDSYRYGRLDERDLVDVLNRMKKDAWEGIFRKTQAQNFMTTSRYESFQKDLEEPEKLPDITCESIRAFIENLRNSAPDMLLDFIKETFDWLKPGGWSMKDYKTNQKSKYELDRKVIKPLMVHFWSGGAKINYHRTSNMKALDNAFSLLDGKGLTKPGVDSQAKIEMAAADGHTQTETDYFIFKWFKNQNMHIEFKRLDLLAKMNQIAGENLVKDVA